MAKKTVENFVARAIRLYEQEPGRRVPPPGLDCTCDGGSTTLKKRVEIEQAEFAIETRGRACGAVRLEMP